MRIALLTRPQWEGSTVEAPDPRIVLAPLQHLQRLAFDDHLFVKGLEDSGQSPWIVFTSPASVEAFGDWVDQKKKTSPSSPIDTIGNAHLAAVGGGTRDRFAALVEQKVLRAQQIEHTLFVEDREKADAQALIAALDAHGQSQGWSWRGQQVWLVQGEDNRPTLAQGLTGLGAVVRPMVLYRRINVPFALRVSQLIKETAKEIGALGIVITSSTVVDEAIKQCRNLSVDPQSIVWCTQHQTIAARLNEQGIQHVRRVSLDPSLLISDLFGDEKIW